MIMGVELDNCKISRNFVKQSSENFIKPTKTNPFIGYSSVAYTKYDKLIYIFSVRAIYPELYIYSPYFFLIGILLYFIFPNNHFYVPLMIGGFIIALTKFFHSTSFLLFVFKRGLKKAKYNGKIKTLTTTEMIKTLINDGDGWRGTR